MVTPAMITIIRCQTGFASKNSSSRTGDSPGRRPSSTAPPSSALELLPSSRVAILT